MLGAITWCIITPKHTLFVGYLLMQALVRRGYHVDLLTVPPLPWVHDWDVVICAQTFRVLPPADRRIIFQLEQCVSAWFTAAYLDILLASNAVLEYSLRNFALLLSISQGGEGLNYVRCCHVVYYNT